MTSVVCIIIVVIVVIIIVAPERIVLIIISTIIISITISIRSRSSTRSRDGIVIGSIAVKVIAIDWPIGIVIVVVVIRTGKGHLEGRNRVLEVIGSSLGIDGLILVVGIALLLIGGEVGTMRPKRSVSCTMYKISI